MKKSKVKYMIYIECAIFIYESANLINNLYN